MNSTLNKSKYVLIENIKLLLYKHDPNIFDKIDYEDDDIYQEPLLYAYFNSKVKKIDLDTIIYGYTKEKLRPEKLKVKSDTYGKFYLPNIGWFITNENNKSYELYKTANSLLYTLSSKEIICDYTFEPIEIIKGTNIELLKYPIPLLDEFYYDINGSVIDVEIENVTKFQRINIEKAFNLIKKLAPKHYKLIESITKKVVIFNVDTTLRNSFATLNAQGICFSNAYQKDYNEVFFIDDIAHQTGHLIFNILIYDVEQFLKIHPETVVEKLHLGNNTTETRNIYVIFHALYTYYTTFICLDAFLDYEKNKYSRNLHEVEARLLFYIGKCYQDIDLIENNEIDNIESINDIFTLKGKEVYLEIKRKYKEVSQKWREKLTGLNMSNQPYNFTYSKFAELNPLNEKIN